MQQSIAACEFWSNFFEQKHIKCIKCVQHIETNTSHIEKEMVEKKDSTTDTVIKRTQSCFVRVLLLINFRAFSLYVSVLNVSSVSNVYSSLRQQKQYTSNILKTKKKRKTTPQTQ